MSYHFNFQFDDHTSIPFKLVDLKPSPDGDRNTLPHRHNYYELFVFDEVGIGHSIDFGNYPVRQQELHLVPPGRVHLLRRGKETTGHVLLFSRDFYHLQMQAEEQLSNEMLLNHQQSTFAFKCSPPEYQLVKQIIEIIRQSSDPEGIHREAIVALQLNAILQLIKSKLPNAATQAAPPDVSFQFIQSMNEQFQKRQQIQEYCEELNVSSGQLNEMCKRRFGKSASALLKDRLLLEGKRLLLHSNLSNKEIASFLGMDDPNYFSRWVSKNCECSPKELRVKLRANFL